MKVKELLKSLQGFDPEMDLCCYLDDSFSSYVNPDLFDIISLEVVEAEKSRLENGQPVLKFQKSNGSEKHVMISITADF